MQNNSDMAVANTFGERLRIALERREKDVSDLAEAINVDATTVYRWINNERSPQRKNREAVANALAVSEKWLKSGVGEMDLPGENGSVSTREPSAPLALLPRADDQAKLRLHQEVHPSAGPGRIIYEVEEREWEDLEYSRTLFRDLLGFWPPEDLRGLYIEGRSMEPGIRDKQLVLYRQVDRLESGKRYILLIEDAHTGDWPLHVKRVQVFAGGGLMIISDNPGAGLVDEVLRPNGNSGHYIHERTGVEVRVQVVGQVLWPRDGDDYEQTRLVTRTIERLATMGRLKLS